MSGSANEPDPGPAAVGEIAAARRALQSFPDPIGIIDKATRKIVWANAAMRAGLGCGEWPDLQLERRFDNAELDLARISFDRFSESGQSYSMIRSFFIDGRFVRIRNTYWPLESADGGFHYAGVLTEPFRRRTGQSLGEWLDEWPQPCALIHDDDGTVHINRRLRDLVGLGDEPIDESLLARLWGSDDGAGVLEALRTHPDTTTVIELVDAVGSPVAFVVARAPLPPDCDPKLTLIVGYDVNATRDVETVALPDSFSRREREVCELLLAGHRVSTIASTLFLSPHTVRNHLRSIFIKTGVTSQAELVAQLRSGAQTDEATRVVRGNH